MRPGKKKTGFSTFFCSSNYAAIIMSRTLGLDDIPLDVFRGIVAFGMGRFTVGRLDGG